MNIENKRPELGTAEAAVLAFVNVLDNAMEMKEEQLAYWLDCYYQLRRHYERELGAPADLMILKQSDLEPVFRQLWQETLKKSTSEEAARRLAAKSQRKTAPAAKAQQGPPEGTADLPGFEPVAVPASPAAAAAVFKRETRDRLETAREQGLSIGAIVSHSNGTLTENQILTILEGGRQSVEVYRDLAAVLDQWHPVPDDILKN